MKNIEHKEIKYKLIMLGDENVGKTSIINRFKNNEYSGTYEPTLGLDFQTKSIMIDNINVKLLLYDTAGQEKFRPLIPLYTKEANIIFLIYDITNYNSFSNIDKWHELLNNMNKGEEIFFLVGNKIDLIEERKVKEEDAKNYADNNNFIFQEVSALKGDGIEELFYDKLASQIKKQLLNNEKFIKDQEEEKLKFNLQDINKGKTKKKKNAVVVLNNTYFYFKIINEYSIC